MPQTPTDPTKAQVWVTGTAPNQQLEFYIPRGAKGEPGGYTAGTPLLSNNLNDIKVPGIYKQDNGSLVTLLLNYPVVASGIMHVDERVAGGSGSVMQTFYPFSGASGINPRSFYKRYMVSGSTWGPWEAYASQRISETAGRAIYTWDTINQRDQLVYGDTGWRTMTLDPATFSTDNGVRLRRIGNTVHMRIVDTTFTTAASTTPIFNLPVGFRTEFTMHRWLENASQSLNPPLYHARMLAGYDGTLPHGVIIVQNARTTLSASTRLQGEFSWVSYENWPTTLPGTAYGSIPNA